MPRCPAALSVEDIGAAFVVMDSAEQKLAYVYFDNPRAAAKPFTRDEARRVAVNIAIPALLRTTDGSASVAATSNFRTK